MGSDRRIFEHPRVEPRHWSNAQLDALRQVTDEPADALIAEYFAAETAHPHALLMDIMAHRTHRRGGAPDLAARSPVPQRLLDELERRCPLPTVDPEMVRHGEALFQDHGPAMLLGLACFSLPMAYSAANGARVLHETGYLEHRVARRLIETTQMVVDVMQPRGLGPGGAGLRSAHEIRLVHAAVRHLIERGDVDWDPAWGRPINQEDMAGTLMTFSYVILDGLSKIGFEVPRHAQEAYLGAWRSVGQAMGLKPELLPEDMEQAQELTWFIFDRQTAGSEAGKRLTSALLQTMRAEAPLIARPFCSSLVRVYVEPQVAEVLEVPRKRLLDALTLVVQKLYGRIHSRLHRFALGRWLQRLVSRVVIDTLTRIGRGDRRAAEFDIPDSLHVHWGTKRR
ncbi:MAG TPA: oxygenase MpaB family protein [Pseudomonadales bacterium]|nr:oxygenase MpaB family protein [Pseudomonadales bacterium]